MNVGHRPGGSEVVDRLRAELAGAKDRDSLARTLLTGLLQPGGLCGLRGAALGLVEGAGRRMRLVFSDDDLGGPGRPAAWTYVDAYDDVPLNHVVRTGDPVWGCNEQLDASHRRFVRARRQVVDRRQEKGAVSLAVLPLGPCGPGADALAPPGLRRRPLGALLLSYDECQEFGPDTRRELDLLAGVIGDALERLTPDRRDVAVNEAAPNGAAPDSTAENRVGPTTATSPTPPAGVAGRAVTALPSDERAPALARHFLRDRLREWSVAEDAASTAELCVSELVTNAVIHGGGHSTLVVALAEDELEVSVRDHGTVAEVKDEITPVTSRGEGSMRVHGRGLMLVEALSRRWGADTRPDGTWVWFTLPLAEHH